MSNTEELAKKTKMHPCYNREAHHKYARIHLPVAPACNIQCRYCNRKFDCVNESRPGVTSTVLSPIGALNRYSLAKEKVENLSVVGIAGPGDALANWETVEKTFAFIRSRDPEVVFCLSTNGLMLPAYAEELVKMGVHHVTVTVNAVNPEIGSKIYEYVIDDGKRLEGIEAATLLLERQLEGIAILTAKGVLVKVNTVMIEGVNDTHIPEIVKKIKELGAFIGNIMPLIPAQGSDFADFPLISMKKVDRMREACEVDLQQMKHCKQCRADAVGKLDQDRSLEFMEKKKPVTREYKVAVASKGGENIDQHFGHATSFLIFLVREDGTHYYLDRRQVPQYCGEECDQDPPDNKKRAIEIIKDCSAVLALRIGMAAKKNLEQAHIIPMELYDTIENGLKNAVREVVRVKVS